MDKPIVAMESLPFGGDGLETQPLCESEMNQLAASFDVEEPIIPTSPPVVSEIDMYSQFSISNICYVFQFWCFQFFPFP